MKNLIENKTSVISLIVANLLPLFGLLFFNWDISNMLILYWSENIIIGFFNILKMSFAKLPNKEHFSTNGIEDPNPASKIGLIAFFCVHFGLFTFGHGMFITSFFFTDSTLILLKILNILPIFVILFSSHLLSFLVNYIKKKEYINLAPENLFLQPYKRIGIVHLSIFAVIPLMAIVKNKQALGLALIIIKLPVDLLMHLIERNKFKPAS